MRPTSEYEREINRMTPFEKMLVAIVMAILLLIFSAVTQDEKDQNVMQSQVKQEEMR